MLRTGTGFVSSIVADLKEARESSENFDECSVRVVKEWNKDTRTCLKMQRVDS
jgi:hypothetical protein